ncbi:sugar transferase [Candidatus Saganbacteria bacterium]|nr:sugar transferase [Candidatus Saganbacteria bacterium]
MAIKFILDGCLIAASFVLAYFVRFNILLFVPPDSIPHFQPYLRTLVFIVPLWLALFKLFGLYEARKFSALIDEMAALFLSLSLSTLLLLGFLFLNRELWFSRLLVINAWGIAFILLALSRLLLFFFLRWLRALGWRRRNVLIIGAGEMGRLLAYKLSQDKTSGYKAIGFVEDDPAKLNSFFHGLPVLGDSGAIKRLIVSRKVTAVIFASAKFPAEKILDIITENERYGVEFKLVPGILELIASRLDIDELGGIPLLTVSEIRLRGFNALIKRGVDIILSALCLLLFAPILCFFCLLVKLTSPGPVFFTQERIGLDGRVFSMFKFRSMIENAEQLFPQLEPLSEVAGNIFKIKNDPRITPLGRFMRRLSIDELPQLLNVFFGQMSMVGPRPPLPREVVNYNPWHLKRLRVRPGITGLWQISGRSLLPFEEMVRLDVYYIENWTLWLDFKILMRTIPVVFFGGGAY